ncbi:MAG: histidine phosphatase family protein [Chloroflexi bacterium]|nr:histidine phosphatase family protein [Chloroflexota bacterium]
MKRVVLVRHGSTDANVGGVMRGWSDDPLSTLGVQQAARTAQFVRTLPPVDVIYTSTLPRAIQTGEAIARALGRELHARDDLRELNLGALEGRTERELWAYFTRGADDGRGARVMQDVTFPGGESAKGFLARVLTAWADIGQQHAGSVLVVSHGVFSMVSLGLWLEPDFTRWPRFRTDNCGVSEVVFAPAPEVVRLNETTHLRD